MDHTNKVFAYYCCPEAPFHFVRQDLSHASQGYFSFGENTTCYGFYDDHHVKGDPSGHLHDALQETIVGNGNIYLPFDPDEIVENLRREVYVGSYQADASPLLSRLYYFIRPTLPVALRKHIQQFHFWLRRQSPFPRWPVDSSVDNVFETLMLLALRASDSQQIPFIWFWPDEKTSCAIMTHDVESAKGRDFCSELMDIDDSYDIKSSFQVIPEGRYEVPEAFLQSIRHREFEIAVHDLNHDGHLYHNQKKFLQRAGRINTYLKQFQTEGFRAGVLYRQQFWYSALKCAYDMSVPNAARFDPQRGGCCTVMPYFVGDILELPVTTVQDYTLFHILNDYSIDIWKKQTEEIMKKHGLMSFIVHPDYIMEPRARSSYESLLEYLRHLQQDRGVWTATPSEVNHWWRARAAMRLVDTGGKWEIQGEASERATIAYASEENGQLRYTLTQSGTPPPSRKGTSDHAPASHSISSH